MCECETYALDNGLRIIRMPSLSPVVYCGFAVNAGTRDEADGEEGMAHFVEHLLFKGTEKRKAWHILNRMENVGGDLNAFTNKEETVVYSAFLKEHFQRAFELLSDIVFHSVFPQREIDKEVEVVLDEIRSYEDSPSELIYDEFEGMVFQGHPLGRNILGLPERLKAFRTEDVLRFVRRCYCPANMVFFLKGDVPMEKIVRCAGRYLPGVPSGCSGLGRKPPLAYVPFSRHVARDTHQAHVMMGCRAYHAYDERRTGLFLLNNILGGPGMNSRLNVALRERRGLVYNVESCLVSYTDAGMFCIYFGTDHGHAERCMSLVRAELKKLREQKLTGMQLSAAKKQLIGQIGVASDNFENEALDMGKSFLHYNRFDSRQALFERIEKVDAAALLEIANELFAEGNLSVLSYD